MQGNELFGQSNRYRFYIEAKHSTYRSQQVGNCIKYYKNLREQLQNNLDKLNKVEATQRGRERPDHVSPHNQSRTFCFSL